MALDQPFLMQPVEHANQRDRLDVEHRRDGGLTLTLMPRDRQQDARLMPGERQPGLARAAFEIASH